jgi:NAD(P)H-hydrate epimerase
MQKADQDAGQRFGVDSIQLMEVAGLQLSRLAAAWLADCGGQRVLVVAGSGNNGGDALVAGRHLRGRGYPVEIRALDQAPGAQSLMARHLRTGSKLGLPIGPLAELRKADCDLVLDGLLGTGVRPPLREPMPAVIAWMNSLGRDILAVDLPSGYDADGGKGAGDCVQAALTLTLALPKPALRPGPPCGRLFLADIGMPAEVFDDRAEQVRQLFGRADIIELI